MAHLSIIIKPSGDYDVAVTDTAGVYLNDQFTRLYLEKVLQALQDRKALNLQEVVGDPRDVRLQDLEFGPALFQFTPIDVGLSTSSWSVDLVFPSAEGPERRRHIGRFETVMDTVEKALDQVYREPEPGEAVKENLKK